MGKKRDIGSIIELGWKFSESRILFTAIELGLFKTLLPSPKTVLNICAELGTDQRGTRILLDALSALGLLEKDHETYSIPADIARLIDPEGPENARGILEHLAHLWDQWHYLTPIVKGEKKIEDISVISHSKERLTSFIHAMDVMARNRAPGIVQAVDPTRSKKVLDVGGASGTYSLAFLEASPDLHVTLFDLPDVIKIAQKRFENTQYQDRITLVAGDFYKDPLPAGHDLVFLSAIIHQNSLKQNEELFVKAFNALDPGGRILIRDFIMDESRTDPPRGALFAVNMLVNTPGGNTYTFTEVKETLEKAGFQKVRQIETEKDMDNLVEAIKTTS